MSTTSKLIFIYLLLATTACEQTYDHTISDKSYKQNHRKGKNMLIDNLLKTVLGGHFDDIFEALRNTYSLPDGLGQSLEEHDFIIVGAGSAGSAIAAKLTENSNVTVLLLEAGKSEMLLTDAPFAAPIFQSTEYSWPYYMEPQEGVCMGMDNQRCYWPRGRAVGGTSVINYMIYTRGRPHDWDRMEAAGNYGWSYKDIIRYYIGMERAELGGYEKQPHRGREGDIPITFVPYQTKLQNAFLEAGELLGSPTVDYNAPERLGFGTVQCTMQNGHRFSAAKVYLHPNKNRKNLHILEQTRVLQVLIDPTTKTAYGVKYQHKRQARTAIARKEIILSAGPIASPQLLMLSGVGPANHLKSLNIPVIQDLPVGRVLYDHICFPGLIFTLNETNLSIVENRMLNVKTMSDWLIYGDNEMGSTGVEGIGYIKTRASEDPDPGVPDIELIALGGSLASDGGPGASKAIRRGMRLNERVMNEAFGKIDGTDTWSAFPMLLYPKSVGYLELKDKNPFSNPRMYGNYLTDYRDVETFIAAIRYIQSLVATPPFQSFGARVHPAKYKYCSSTTFDSDEYWECALRTLTVTLHHQVGTCRMGPDSDRRSVVDPELRVRGVQNLRVADSSIIPYPLAAHTHAPATVIGLKAANLIKSRWKI